jgi:hypothetical protein
MIEENRSGDVRHSMESGPEAAGHETRVRLYAACVAAGRDLTTGRPLTLEELASCHVSPGAPGLRQDAGRGR